MEEKKDLLGEWALILGVSSGFGAACALELASENALMGRGRRKAAVR